jgi:hypothetical protein
MFEMVMLILVPEGISAGLTSLLIVMVRPELLVAMEREPETPSTATAPGDCVGNEFGSCRENVEVEEMRALAYMTKEYDVVTPTREFHGVRDGKRVKSARSESKISLATPRMTRRFTDDTLTEMPEIVSGGAIDPLVNVVTIKLTLEAVSSKRAIGPMTTFKSKMVTELDENELTEALPLNPVAAEMPVALVADNVEGNPKVIMASPVRLRLNCSATERFRLDAATVTGSKRAVTLKFDG